MSLNKNEITKLADLAKLSLTEEEKEKFSLEISSILQYVSKLQEVRPQAEILEKTENNLRPDRVIGQSAEKQTELINLAPETENNLVKTRPVFNKE